VIADFIEVLAGLFLPYGSATSKALDPGRFFVMASTKISGLAVHPRQPRSPRRKKNVQVSDPRMPPRVCNDETAPAELTNG
jgi:hypothetical protein